MKPNLFIRFTAVSLMVASSVFLVFIPQPPVFGQADDKVHSPGSAEKSWTRPRFSDFGEERARMVQTQMVQRSPSIRDSEVL